MVPRRKHQVVTGRGFAVRDSRIGCFGEVVAGRMGRKAFVLVLKLRSVQLPVHIVQIGRNAGWLVSLGCVEPVHRVGWRVTAESVGEVEVNQELAWELALGPAVVALLGVEPGEELAAVRPLAVQPENAGEAAPWSLPPRGLRRHPYQEPRPIQDYRIVQSPDPRHDYRA